MVRISSMMNEELVNLSLESNTKEKVIEEMARAVLKRKVIHNQDEFLRAILDRENLESTGIGRGIAIPHARTNTIDEIVIVFGRSKGGVDFASLDGKPVQLFFLIVAPEKERSAYINVLARLSRLLRKEEFRKNLEKASTAKKVIELIEKNEETL
ncbi:PTS sugar transporter subunit IIA [candidate division TA06 bacterium]|nr:PTS sugar transporter subunit IIA [candidate division TA06 bacterium]